MECVDLLSRLNISNSALMGLDVGYHCAVLYDFEDPIVLQYSWPGKHSAAVVSQESTIQIPYCNHTSIR